MDERERLACELIPLALSVARMKCREMRKAHLADEGESHALLTLWKAVLDYDPSRGTTVEQHVAARVRMATRDLLRSLAWREAGELPEGLAGRGEGDDGQAESARRLLSLAGEAERPILSLVYLDGLTRAEAAQRAGIRDRAAEDAVRRGLDAIRSARRVGPPDQPGRLTTEQAGRLVLAMRRQGCTAAGVESRCGFNHHHLAEVLAGRKGLTTETLSRIAGALCVQSDWVLHGDERRGTG